MHQPHVNEVTTKFPIISFRRKRLTVDIHAQFDMECAADAASVKQMIETAISELAGEGKAKVSYSVSDL
jgi:hypothetical protein